jgi:hypothetical protein
MVPEWKRKVRRNGWSLFGLLLLLGVGMWSGSVGPPSADNWREDAGGRRFRVGKNGFFEFENGETFYPIAAFNCAGPFAWEGAGAGRHDEDFVTTFALYLQCLARHGFNTLLVEEKRDPVKPPRGEWSPPAHQMFFFGAGEQRATYREEAVKMLRQIGSKVATTGRAGSRRLRTVSVRNLQRFTLWDWNRWDPELNRAAYLDNSLNDYIDYHLYTWTGWDPSVWFTEYPQDPYTPMKYYLGVNVGVQQDLRASSCTLPEVIDHNRYAPGGGHRLGGFFSSEFGLPRWDDPTTRGYARKRLINDCYHNYLWLGMATGSVGGPTPLWPPRSWWRKYYDLSGITYLNPFGESLNCYTDEILDSMLSLSRFTSLVHWKFMRDSYRPVRVQHQSSDTTITLRVSQGGSQLSQNDWLWTAASDTTFTVGWIVRNCPRDYTIPESQNALTTATAPWLHIQHLAQIPLELVWFDDHLGQIVGSRSYSTSGTFNVVTPNTEGKNGFARSLAFLIQPTGLTASKSYAALPDEKIGMIGAAPLDTNEKWYEEGQKVLSGPLTFTVRTKPATNPSGLTFEWRFDSDTTAPIVVSGEDHIHRTYTASEEWRFVKVDIKDQQNKRVSGDITYVWVNPN